LTRIYAGPFQTVSSLPKGLFDHLQELLQDRDEAFAVIEFVSEGPDNRQIDCAIFSPGGVDIIEIKDKKNPVVGSASGAWKTDDGGVLNEFSNTKRGRNENPYQQAASNAKDAHTWLSRRRGVLGRRLQVFPLVLIPFAAPGCRIGPDNWVNLALGIQQLSGALRALTSRERVWEPADYLGLPPELGLIPIDLTEITGKTIDRVTGKALQRVQVEATGLEMRTLLQVDTRGNFTFTARPGLQVTLRLLPSTLHLPLERVLEVGPDTRLIELGELYFDPIISPQSVAQSERELLQVQAEMEQLRSEHAQEVQRLLNGAQQARREAEEAIHHMQRRQQQEARDLERLQSQRAADLLRVEQLEASIAEANTQLATLSAARPEEADRIGQLEAERQTQLVHIEALRQARQRQEQQATKAEERAALTAQELARLQEELPGHLKRLRQLEGERETQAAELEALRAENARVQQELAHAATQQNRQGLSFTQEALAAQQRLEFHERLAEADQVRSSELDGERERFAQREAHLREQLGAALARLAAQGRHEENRPGTVLARAVAWLNRDSSELPSGLPRSPLARVAINKLQAGNITPSASLPSRPRMSPDLALWNLPAEELLPHMQVLLDFLEGELSSLPSADRPLRKGQIKRLRDSLEDLKDGAEEALEHARAMMVRLAPQGPAKEAPDAEQEPQQNRFTLTGTASLSSNARLWVLHEGQLRDLATGETAQLVPGMEQVVASGELDGLVGLCEDTMFVPVWALPRERQIEAWLPDSWAAALVEDEASLARLAAQLSVVRFGVVCRSLPLEQLLAWTGELWPLELQAALHQALLAVYAQTLRQRGVPVQDIPVQATQTPAHLQLTDLEPVPTEEGMRAHSGLNVPLKALDLDARVVHGLDPRVRESGLYLHQALALHLIREAQQGSHDVVLSTPTASGKTMAFLPGVLEGVLQSRGHALFLYPLRALSADQLGKLEEVLERMEDDAPLLGRHFGGEDVDLSKGPPQLLVATPDKLNHALDKAWLRSFAAQLRYVVLDEAHTYRGAFGANMSAFLRRLLMLCPEPPTLILSSATLQNTLAFARLLTGREHFRVVGASSAPRYPRHLYVGQPRAGWGYRPHLGALRGFGKMVRARTSKGLIFAGSRQGSREIARELREPGDHPAAPTAFPFYSGMQQYDKELGRLRDTRGQPLIAASTSTLEAGIDIGDLDMVAVVGFPRSRNSFKQMAGRAGRAGPAHIAFLPGASPADMYYAHPEALANLLLRESEPVYLNPHNPILVEGHVARARYEAECAGLQTGPDLLNTLFPEGLHAEDEVVLRHTFDLPVTSVRAPLLRGDGTEPHVVVSVGGRGQPRPDQVDLTIPEEGAEWLLERLSPEVAYRDWPLEGRATRGERFYRVLGWRRGRIRDGEDGYAQAAIIIAVLDITEQTLAPEEVIPYRVKAAGEQVLPSGRYAPRTVSRKTHLDVVATRLANPVEFGAVSVAVGVGEVSLKEGDLVEGELLAGALCERADRTFRVPKLEKDEPTGVEVLPPGSSEPHAWQVSSLTPWLRRRSSSMSSRSDDPLWTAYTLPEGMVSRFPAFLQASPEEPDNQRGKTQRTRPRHEVLPALDPNRAIKALQVSLHEHELHTQGVCRCGGQTTLRQWWAEPFSEAEEQLPALPDDPARTEAHDISRHAFSTEMAQIRISGGDDGARRALLLAMVKAIPDLMEVDPQEFSVGITHCSEDGPLEAYMWDVVPGGTGISAALEEVLPSLLAAASALLGRALDCSCGERGCFGCLLPLERVIDLIPDKSSDFDRLKDLGQSGFADELQVQGALRLCVGEESR